MDPQAALDQLRDRLRVIKEAIDGSEACLGLVDTGMAIASCADEVNEVVDLFAGLDEWMSKGGFLPRDWQQGRTKKR